MHASDAVLPVCPPVVWGDDAVLVERWAAEQRDDLARLSEELRAAHAHAAALEHDGGSAGPGPSSPPPAHIAGLVDALLDAARTRRDAAIGLARAEAGVLLARAQKDAAEILLGAGAQPPLDHEPTPDLRGYDL